MEHAARPRLLGLAAVLASVLLGSSAAALLSLVAFLDVLWVGTVAMALALTPLAIASVLSISRRPGHRAAGRAAFFVADGLACASRSWAIHLAPEQGSAGMVRRRLREPLHGPYSVAGPILSVFLCWFFHDLFNPLVTVLNFGDEPGVLWVDGHRLGVVAPSTGESPFAGQQFRIPFGRRELEFAAAGGTALLHALVRVRPGHRHLFAPGSRPGCFAIQRYSFGRVQGPEPGAAPLTSDARFWSIPNDVDLWFAAPPSSKDSRSTGGLVTVLRQGQCR